MTVGTLEAALEQEHREVDAGLEEFADGLAKGEARTVPLAAAIAALRRHIYLEEELLFPPLQKTGLVAAIFAMLREHGEIWKSMDKLEAQVSAGGDDASKLEASKMLAEQIEAHNVKEERIVYPQADSLTPEAREALAAFMKSGTMPEGWVCARAR